MRCLPLLLLLSCGGSSEPDTDKPAEIDDEPPFTHAFSFVVFADPHVVSGDSSRAERLAAAVDWVNGQARRERIELVWVVGDIGWGDGLPLARDLLEPLEVTYVPVIGDNEIHFGDEANFEEVFADQFRLLARTFQGFERGPIEVYNPDYDQDSWFYNFRFDHGGIRWIGLDWCSRADDNLISETAELHDFDGGTWPFFEAEMQALEPGPDENVLLFSHHPMHLSVGAFGQDEMARITGLTGPQGNRIAGSWAGHYHLTHDEEVAEGGYEVFITDALWDDENTIRLVKVYGNGERFKLEQELVVVP